MGRRTAQHMEADAAGWPMVPRRQSASVAPLLAIPFPAVEGALRGHSNAGLWPSNRLSQGLTRRVYSGGSRIASPFRSIQAMPCRYQPAASQPMPSLQPGRSASKVARSRTAKKTSSKLETFQVVRGQCFAMTEGVLRGQRHAAGHEAAGRALGLAGVAKQLAFQRIETVGGGEKPIAVLVSHHDSRRLRSNFDDVSVRHLPALLCQMRANNRASA